MSKIPPGGDGIMGDLVLSNGKEEKGGNGLLGKFS
jgi:hypothetical protein